MTKSMKIVLLLLVAVSCAGSAYFLNRYLKASAEAAQLRDENVNLRKEKLMLLEEHKKALEENNKCIRKELVVKYMEFIYRLREKIDSKQEIPVTDKKLFIDRADFVVENLDILELKPEEAKSYLSYILSIKNALQESDKK